MIVSKHKKLRSQLMMRGNTYRSVIVIGSHASVVVRCGSICAEISEIKTKPKLVHNKD